MLTKRAQILFDQHLWNQLVKLAKKHQTSVGEVIRDAAEKRVSQEINLEKRKEAIDYILKHRPAPVKGKIDYKELINEGRRF